MDNIDANIAMKNHICCDDIYLEKFNQSIRFLNCEIERTIYKDQSSLQYMEMFLFASRDFYNYRRIIDSLENSKVNLLKSIICSVMDRYQIQYTIPKRSPFEFIIYDKVNKIGYSFLDSYQDFYKFPDIDNVTEGIIIKTWSKKDTEFFYSSYEVFKNGIKLKTISLESFFIKYFCKEEYNSFFAHIKKYKKEVMETIGYKTIKVLSPMHFSEQKKATAKELAEWEYCTYSYQIIDKKNPKIKNYAKNIFKESFSASMLQDVENNYISKKLYKTMIGTNDYAESFITSEWIYHSLYKKKNFDYTSIISGYLKSIEQLLRRIILLNVDNNCKITINKDKIKEDRNNIVLYKKSKNGRWDEVCENEKLSNKDYYYIDLTTTQSIFMDESIGTFVWFLKNNTHIFNNSSYINLIADMISCFRTECRNGFFHTHNLKDWEVVEKIRSNAIYLYFLLLGNCIIPENRINDLAITVDDTFDQLCENIIELSSYDCSGFVFVYNDTKSINVKYSYDHNYYRSEYYSDGVLHYGKLKFYKIESFSKDSKEKNNTMEKQEIFLTRDTLPKRIFVVHHNMSRDEISL